MTDTVTQTYRCATCGWSMTDDNADRFVMRTELHGDVHWAARLVQRITGCTPKEAMGKAAELIRDVLKDVPNLPVVIEILVTGLPDGPVNNVGATEEEWNTWKAAVEKWEADNPVPRHTPYETCDCTDMPQLPRVRPSWHCAAREPIAPWKPATGPQEGP